MKRKIFVEATCTLFVILFFYTAVSKIIDFSMFYRTLHDSRFKLVGKAAPVLVVAVPLAEILVSIGLVLERYKTRALRATMVMMAIFLAYVAGLMIFIPFGRLPCSCGGIMQQITWHNHLYLNIALTILAALALWARTHPKNEPSLSRKVKYSQQ
jgi:hypothetical protein